MTASEVSMGSQRGWAWLHFLLGISIAFGISGTRFAMKATARPRFWAILPFFVPLLGCAMTIRPPATTAEPATVFLADYLHHASLFLPNDDDTWCEYAYGEWEWFALNRESALDAVRISLFPSRGTLGRKTWRHLTTADQVRLLGGFEAVYELTVDARRALELRQRLEAEFDRERATRVYNSEEQMEFVHYRNTYWLGWNCNNAVAEWLEVLGCEIRGPRTFAEFRFEPSTP